MCVCVCVCVCVGVSVCVCVGGGGGGRYGCVYVSTCEYLSVGGWVGVSVDVGTFT